jgi:hypothetical protein
MNILASGLGKARSGWFFSVFQTNNETLYYKKRKLSFWRLRAHRARFIFIFHSSRVRLIAECAFREEEHRAQTDLTQKSGPFQNGLTQKNGPVLRLSRRKKAEKYN